MTEHTSIPKSEAALKGRWGFRLIAQDVRRARGTIGALLVSGGGSWRSIFWSVLTIGAFVAAVDVINVITIMHDHPAEALWRPIVDEASSGISSIAFVWVPLIALGMAARLRSPVAIGAALLGGALLFSAAHVAGFVLIRKLVFPLFGHNYKFGGLRPFWNYELYKDVLEFITTIAIFWTVRRLSVAQPTKITGSSFIIRDGARATRIDLSEVLAVGAAGNYVEFALADGRKLLMRSSLAAIEAQLAAKGFLRTHRSWLVNRDNVRSVRPEGSGDYSLEVGALVVPVSRRYPEAIATLKNYFAANAR